MPNKVSSPDAIPCSVLKEDTHVLALWDWQQLVYMSDITTILHLIYVFMRRDLCTSAV